MNPPKITNEVTTASNNPMINLSIPKAVWKDSQIVLACTALKTNPNVIVIKIEKIILTNVYLILFQYNKQDLHDKIHFYL